MRDANERTRLGRYTVLPFPVEPRVVRVYGASESASFFFAWGAEGAADGDGALLSGHDADLAQKRRRSFRSGSTSMNWVRGAIAEAELEADDDSTLSVCRTSLFDRTKRESDPDRFIDSCQIPYLTLGTRRAFRETGVGLGDLATVVCPSSGRYCHAIVGDAREVVGVEPSLDLIEKLGMSLGESAIYLIHPESGQGQGTIPSAEQIARQAERLFRRPLEEIDGGWGWDLVLVDYFTDLVDADTRWVECGDVAGRRAWRA